MQTLSVKYAEFGRQSHNGAVCETIQLQQWFIASLRGEATVALTFDDGTFDDQATALKHLECAKRPLLGDENAPRKGERRLQRPFSVKDDIAINFCGVATSIWYRFI